MNQIKVAPKEVFVQGIVVGISDELDRNKRKFRMVTLEKPDKTQETFPINKSFFERNQNTLVIDANVTLKFQETIADTTEYLDKEGAVQKHTATGRAIASITRQSSVSAKLAQLDNKIEQLVTKYEDRPELIGQFAQAYAIMLK